MFSSILQRLGHNYLRPGHNLLYNSSEPYCVLNSKNIFADRKDRIHITKNQTILGPKNLEILEWVEIET